MHISARSSGNEGQDRALLEGGAFNASLSALHTWCFNEEAWNNYFICQDSVEIPMIGVLKASDFIASDLKVGALT